MPGLGGIFQVGARKYTYEHTYKPFKTIFCATPGRSVQNISFKIHLTLSINISSKIWRWGGRCLVYHLDATLWINKQINKQEVLERPNRLLSYNTTWSAQKTPPPTVLHCRGNVFTELFPSNDIGIHRPPQTRGQQFFYRCVYSLLRQRVYRAVA
jgi:hypothetical protein